MISPPVVWMLLVLSVLGMALSIVTVGRPRQPLSGGAALITCIFGLVQLWAYASLLELLR